VKGRLLGLCSACAWVVLIAAFAQSNINQAENPPIANEQKPAALTDEQKPAALTDEQKPASVTTPTSDAEANAEAQPLAPQAPGETPDTGVGTTMQPEPIAPGAEPIAPGAKPIAPGAELIAPGAEPIAPGAEPIAPGAELIAPGAEQIAPRAEQIAPRAETVVADQAVIPPEPSRKLWRISPLFSAGVVYDDNIFVTNTDRVADVIWTFPFGLSFELGDFRSGFENYVTAQWIGIPTFYTNNPSENHFNQAGSLLAQYRWTKLAAQFRSGFGVSREANREVNTITTTQTLANSLRFQYDYSEKTSFDLQFRQEYSASSNPSTPSGGTSATPTPESGKTTNNEYQTRAGMNYQMFPKTTIGLEAAGGISDQSDSPLQYYQQARVRLIYVATGKLNLKFSGGVEVREFEGTNRITISPVFSLGLDYRPFDGTTISVVGYRNISPATSITGQDITATGFNISATQRFLQKFIAGISFGYENDVYSANPGETTVPGESTTQTNRVDNYLYVRSRLTYSFVRWCSANAFYEHRRTNSSQASSSFYDNRIGMELAAEF
jgi:Putative beta-barrel porin 2